MTKYRWALCELAVLLGLTATSAAALEELPMQVRVARSAQPGCEPDCAEWISAQGKIVAGQTLHLVKSALRRLQGRKLPVFLHSGGGDVREALAIGRLIRTYGLDTAVIKTEFAACAAGDTACSKQEAERKYRATPQELALCASACTFVLAGGIRRFAGPWTHTGVHQLQSFTTYAKVQQYYRVTEWPDGRRSKTLVSERVLQRNTVRSEPGESRYNEIGQYFASMGVAGNIMQLTRSAPNTSVHWMTADELTSTQLITSRTTGLELLPGFVAPKQAAPLTPAAGTAPASINERLLKAMQATPQSLPSFPPAAGTAPAGPREWWLKGTVASPSFQPPGSLAKEVSPAADGPASAEAISPPSSGQSPSP